jgi:hypothetical protein
MFIFSSRIDRYHLIHASYLLIENDRKYFALLRSGGKIRLNSSPQINEGVQYLNRVIFYAIFSLIKYEI